MHCSLWLFVGTKNQNEQQKAKKSKWKPGLMGGGKGVSPSEADIR